MYCTECGAKTNDSDQHYCIACGRPLTQPPALPSKPPVRSLKRPLLVIVVSAVCIAGVVVAILALTQSSDTVPPELLVKYPAGDLSKQTRAGAFSPDGQYLVTVDDHGVYFWNARTWRKLQYTPITFAARAVVFAHDNSKVAILGDSQTQIYKPENAVLLEQLTAGGKAAAFAPNNQYLQVADEKSLSRFDAAGGNRLETLQSEYPLSDAVFSSDGSTIAVSNARGSFVMLSAATGQEIRPLKTDSSDDIHAVAFSSLASRIAVVSRNNANVIDVTNGHALRAVSCGDGYPLAAAISPLGNRIAYACSSPGDGTVRVVDVSSGRTEGVFHDDFRQGLNSATWLEFSPDGNQVATRNAVWDLRDAGKPQTGHAGWVEGIDFSLDGSRAYSAGDEGVVHAWDTGTGAEIQHWTTPGECPAYASRICKIEAAAFDSLRSRIALVDERNTTAILSLRDGHVLKTFPTVTSSFTVFRDHIGWVAFSPDGSKIAWGSEYGGRHSHYIVIWDINSGQKVTEFGAGNIGVRTFRFSADSTKVIAVIDQDSRSGSVTVSSASNGQRLYQIDGGDGFEFYGDGSKIIVRIASPSAAGRMQIVDVGSGQVLSTFQVGQEVTGFDLSPDGTKAVMATKDGPLLWNLETGNPVKRLEGHVGAVNNVKFSHAGSVVLTAGDDHTVRLWSADDGHLVRILEGCPSAVVHAIFSPDDSRVAASLADSRIWFWQPGAEQNVEAH